MIGSRKEGWFPTHTKGPFIRTTSLFLRILNPNARRESVTAIPNPMTLYRKVFGTPPRPSSFLSDMTALRSGYRSRNSRNFNVSRFLRHNLITSVSYYTVESRFWHDMPSFIKFHLSEVPARMAKYCFYCGQELAPGEKCKCRNAGGTGSTKETKRSRSAPNTQTGGKGDAPKSAKTDPSSGPRIRKSFKEKASRPVFRFRTFSDQLRTLFPTFTSGVMSCAGYILRPAAKIRQESLRARRPFSIVNIAVFCVLTGVLSVLLVYSGSRLFSGMMDSITGETARQYCANHPASRSAR